MSDKPKGAGKSSFDHIDQPLFLDILTSLAPGHLVDLGCGAGNYSVALAGRLGPGHTVTGVDLWAEGIDTLRSRAEQEGLTNLRGLVGGAEKIPLDDQSVDLILMGTVFHDFVATGKHEAVLAECLRVLTAGGGLAVVEFQKIDGPPGPPKAIRLAPDQLATMMARGGFSQTRHLDLGAHTYLSLFAPTAR